MRTDPVNWSYIAGRPGHYNVRRKHRFLSITLLALIALVLIMLLGRHGSAANSPTRADLTGMANPNVRRENPGAPLT
jgi:hypothetical protein